MTAISSDDDLLVFSAETGDDVQQHTARDWRVLIVDDDADVHHATELALRGVPICGRQLTFLHAYSGAQAMEMLREDPSIAVVLLDVVMETERAGLDLVKTIRDTLALLNPRIILRTGQPGYAPEIDAIRDYGINDYWIKSELTRTKLFSTLTAALRSFEQIQQLDAAREGLELLLQGSAELIGEHGLQAFAIGVITQLAAFLRVRSEGLICAGGTADGSYNSDAVTIIGAAGRYAELVQRPLKEMPAGPERRALEQALRDQRTSIREHSVALYLPSRTGEHFAVYIEAQVAEHSMEARLLDVYCQNIAICADNVRLVERLRDTAYVDSLLRIANRSALCDAIDQRLADAAGQAPPARLVLVDIDGFSELNETFGDRFGDELLHAVTSKLTRNFAQPTLVARIANDTFGLLGEARVLQPNVLREVFAQPIMVGEVEIAITASFGATELTDKVGSGGEAIKFGYSALKRARADGAGSFATYSREVGDEIAERTHLLQGLRYAFDHQRTFLVYQPQIDARSGAVLGFEALMRWRNEDQEMVPPDRFIPIAESSGLIKELGAWVLHEAMRTGQELIRGGCDAIRMAVNVSMVQIVSPEFEAQLARALADTGFPPQQLEIEITESVAMHSPEVVIRRLDALHRIGVTVAIDDFGTGFSSLSYLERLAVDRLKIDRSFVTALGHARGGARIAGMVIDLGKTLGLKVLAEGVETIEQRDRLLELGCDELQGYLIARPMPAEQLAGWLAGRV